MLEGVTTINGVPPAQISSNTALLGGVTSTLLSHGTSILSNANAIAALPNANNTIVEAATSLGTDAFDFLADDVTTDMVEIGTPLFPLKVNSSHIVLQNGVFRTDGIVVINENPNSNEPAETKLRLHGTHTGITLGVNELDNYIDFILHQSIPLTTGGYLAISGNGGTDLVRFYYAGAGTKKTDFLGGHLSGVSQIDNGSTSKLKLGSGSSDVTIHGINTSVVGSTTTYIGNKLHFRDDDTHPDAWIRWGGYSNTGGVLNVVSNGLQLHGFDCHEFHIGNSPTPGIPIRMRLNATGLYLAGSFIHPHNFSDDRLKTNETPLLNATETLLKLKPQTYLKSVPESNKDPMIKAMLPEPTYEAGFIAHDTWNDVPEVRHIIQGVDESLNTNFNDGVLQENHQTMNAETKIVEPQYLSIEYAMLVPYLVASIKELHIRIAQLEGN